MDQENSLTAGEITATRWISSNKCDLPEGDFCPDRFELIFIKRAKGIFNIEGAEFSISDGSLILINPFTYYNISLCAEVELYRISFAKGALFGAGASIFDGICEGNVEMGKYFPSDLIPPELCELFPAFFIGDRLSHEQRRASFEGLLMQIVAYISNIDGPSITNGDNKVVSRVMRYLNGNIEKNITLDKLAKKFFVSKYYLCRAFKEQNGISLHSYVNIKKISYAKQLIESGETASLAAERVGFSDYSAFYRAYLRVMGKSPSAIN